MPQLARDKVVVVVGGDYGEQLSTLANESPVWVADTPANRAWAEELWASVDPPEITTFVVAPSESPEATFIRVLATIDLHHGEYAQIPPYSGLVVLGAYASAEVRSALSNYAFVVVEQGEASFRASREPRSKAVEGAA